MLSVRTKGKYVLVITPICILDIGVRLLSLEIFVHSKWIFLDKRDITKSIVAKQISIKEKGNDKWSKKLWVDKWTKRVITKPNREIYTEKTDVYPN